MEKVLYVRYTNQLDKHDELCLHFVDEIDFEEHPSKVKKPCIPILTWLYLENNALCVRIRLYTGYRQVMDILYNII